MIRSPTFAFSRRHPRLLRHNSRRAKPRPLTHFVAMSLFAINCTGHHKVRFCQATGDRGPRPHRLLFVLCFQTFSYLPDTTAGPRKRNTIPGRRNRLTSSPDPAPVDGNKESRPDRAKPSHSLTLPDRGRHHTHAARRTRTTGTGGGGARGGEEPVWRERARRMPWRCSARRTRPTPRRSTRQEARRPAEEGRVYSITQRAWFPCCTSGTSLFF